MNIQAKEFNYDLLDVETREFVRQKETAIKARTAQTIIENGRDLKEVKDRLNHGQFQDWVSANFPWSATTAKKMIKAYENFKTTDSVVLESFQREALFLLAAPSTPESARTEAIERAEAGEKITHKQAKELVEAHKKIRDQEQEIKMLSDKVAESEKAKNDLSEKIKQDSRAVAPTMPVVEIEKPAEDYETEIRMLKDALKTKSEKISRLEERLNGPEIKGGNGDLPLSIRYAHMAIAQLEGIPKKDPNKIEALDFVITWCNKKKQEGKK